MTKEGRKTGSRSIDITNPGGSGKDEKGGNKTSTIIRVITVIAYVVGVSTGAALLSAYYIFFWVPQPTEPMQQRQVRVTDSPFSLPQHGNSHNAGGSYYNYPKNAYPNSMELSKHLSHSSRASKKAHSKTTPSPSFLPRPQYLVKQARPWPTTYPQNVKNKK